MATKPTLTIDALLLVQSKVNAAPPSLLTLKKLFGDDWSLITDPYNFGTLVVNSVRAGLLKGMEFAGKDRAHANRFAIKGFRPDYKGQLIDLLD
jgi:hypothetical protein